MLPDLSSLRVCSAGEVSELLISEGHVHGQTEKTSKQVKGWTGGVSVGSLFTGLLLSPAPVPSPAWLRCCDLGSNGPMWHQTQEGKPSQGLFCHHWDAGAEGGLTLGNPATLPSGPSSPQSGHQGMGRPPSAEPSGHRATSRGPEGRSGQPWPGLGTR